MSKELIRIFVCNHINRILQNSFDGKTRKVIIILCLNSLSDQSGFDTSTPMGRAMMYIASVFSQLERETIAERIRDNMHELAKTGRWLGGTPPTGYASEAVKSVTIDGKSKKACKLKLIPEEADIVKMIYNLYVMETKKISKRASSSIRLAKSLMFRLIRSRR